MKKRSHKVKFVNPYKTENELCNILIDYAKTSGWKVYPETSGFDILLVKDIQIGIQAKLKDNMNVLAQAIDGYLFNINNKHYCGPDLRAVLVPYANGDFQQIANGLGIYVILGTSLEMDYITGQYKWMKQINAHTPLDRFNKNYLINTTHKCWVPEIEIDVPAGVKSPKLITPWKLKAVKLCLELENKGYLTSQDFKNAGISIGLWIKNEWLVDSQEKYGKLKKYIKNVNKFLPHEIYLEITKALVNSKKNLF